MMKDIKQEVDKFLQDFASAPKMKEISHGVITSLSQDSRINLKNLKKTEKILCEWFKNELYSSGRIIKELKSFPKIISHGLKIGLSFCVEAEKDKMNIGRYLSHLLLIMETKDRKISQLECAVETWKDSLIEYENSLIQIMDNEEINEDVRNGLKEKFYWLLNSKEEVK